MPFVMDYEPVAALGSLASQAGEAKATGHVYQRAYDHQRNLDGLAMQINARNREMEFQHKAESDMRSRFPYQFGERPPKYQMDPDQEIAIAGAKAGAIEAARRSAAEPYEREDDRRSAEQSQSDFDRAESSRGQRKVQERRMQYQGWVERYGEDRANEMLESFDNRAAGANKGMFSRGNTQDAAGLLAEMGDFNTFEQLLDDSYGDPEFKLQGRAGQYRAIDKYTDQQLEAAAQDQSLPKEIQDYIRGKLVQIKKTPENVSSQSRENTYNEDPVREDPVRLNEIINGVW